MIILLRCCFLFERVPGDPFIARSGPMDTTIPDTNFESSEASALRRIVVFVTMIIKQTDRLSAKDMQILATHLNDLPSSGKVAIGDKFIELCSSTV